MRIYPHDRHLAAGVARSRGSFVCQEISRSCRIVEHGRVLINVAVDGRQSGLRLTGEAFADGRSVASDSTPATGWHNHSLVVNLPKAAIVGAGEPIPL